MYILNEHQFLIRYDGILVNYMGFQEEGTKFFDGNKGFIKVTTVAAIGKIVHNTMNNQELLVNSEVSAIRAKESPARNRAFLRSIKV